LAFTERLTPAAKAGSLATVDKRIFHRYFNHINVS
jgi:hypothetical protein